MPPLMFMFAAFALVACAADGSSGSCASGTAVCSGIDAGTWDAINLSDVYVPTDVFRDVLASIAIRPGAATLNVQDSTPATMAFSAYGTLRDGTTSVLGGVVWSVPPSSIGSIATSTGLFTATGAAGGTIVVTAQVPSPSGGVLSTTASLTVVAHRTYATTGTAPDAAGHFTGPATISAARAPTLDYPLDAAMMPANVAPPDVQWEGGAVGDIYRVTIARPDISLIAYIQHTGTGFTYDWPVDSVGWQALVSSNVGSPVVLTLDRWDAADSVLVAGPSVSLQIARGSLSGAIYYWDLTHGVIRKLDAVTTASSVAVPYPPLDPTTAGNRCIACHTVSRDGRYMSVEMWGGGREGAAFDLTASDLGNNPAPTVIAPQPALTWLFSTWSPDATQLVINAGNALALLDRATGSVIPGANLATSSAAHPEWAPSGRSLAYISNTDGSWAVDFTHGDLTVVPTAGPTSFGSPRVIHAAGSSPGGPVDAHPSFSPDSEWLVFQHGTNSRSGNTNAGSYQIYPGRLEIIGASGGTPTPLTHANGPDGMSGYWPNFSPFDVGGYYWLAYYSRRDYGNAQVGTEGTRRRQIWVVAISDRPTPGTDPSSVPYWMPGQDTSVENMSAYWAPTPCRTNGTACHAGSECCSGTCTAAADGTYTCAPIITQCRTSGQTCSMSSDCCAPLMCAGHTCLASPG